MKNETNQLNVKVLISQEIQEVESINAIRELVDSMIINVMGIDYHKSNEFKYYSHDGFPKANDRKYTKDQILQFRLRVKDIELANKILNSTKGIYTDKLIVVDVQAQKIPKRHIESIYTLTPIIIKFEDGYWRGKKSIVEVEERIKNNLIKKYNSYYNTKIDENFDLFEGIEIQNKYPIKLNYKDITLLGDKFLLQIASNEQAQELANFAIACGLGEMNSRGYGFVRYNWI